MGGRLGRVLGQEQPSGLHRLADASGRVQAGRQGERDRLEVHGRRDHPCALEEGRDPGPRRRAEALQAQSRDRPVLADDGRHVGHGPDRGEVRQGEREGRATGFVAQQQLGDLEGHAAARQSRVRVHGIGPVGVHEGDGVRERRWDPVMVRHDDVQTALAGDVDLGVARGAAVDRDDDRCPGRDRRLDRGERQAVALVEPAGDVRLDGDAEPAKGERHDREAGQAIRIEVTEDQDLLGVRPGSGEPGQEDVGVGQERRIVQSVERLGEPGIQVTEIHDTAPGKQSGHPVRHATRPGRRLEVRRQHQRGGKDPTEARFDHDVRMPRVAAPRLYRSGCTLVRTPGAGPAGRASRRSGRGVGHPTGSSPRRSGSPRRSTRRCRR